MDEAAFQAELANFCRTWLKIFTATYPQHKELAQWLSMHPIIAADIAAYARMYTIPGIGRRVLEQWREHGKVVMDATSEGERSLAFVAGMFEAQGCAADQISDLQQQAATLQNWLPKFEDLFNVEKMGKKPYWLIIAIETILEWGTGKRPTAAQLKAIVDSAIEAKGLKLETNASDETAGFRRDLSNFRKSNQQRVMLVQRLIAVRHNLT